LNRWHVYEWIKQSFMFSGKLPTERDCFDKFFMQMDASEIREGISEFEAATKTNIKRLKYPRGQRGA
jgi:hypothetical protein